MIPPGELARLIVDRADDPARAIIETALLRQAIDRIDDWLLWLETHAVNEHRDSGGAGMVMACGAARMRIRRALEDVDAMLERIDDE